MLSDRHVEKLEILDGSRGGTTTAAAVRLADLAPLLRIQTRLQAVKAAGSTPTKEEFDALVGDLDYLNNRLIEVMQLLQQRLLP
jgi:hypothetical protein